MPSVVSAVQQDEITVPTAASLTEAIYGFKFGACYEGTKGEGHPVGWLQNPINAAEVEHLHKVRPRNLKVITGEVSGCIAVDVDEPQLAYEYLESIGKTLWISTSRGYRWFFQWIPEMPFNKEVLPDGVEVMGNQHSGTIAGRHPGGKRYNIEDLPDRLLPLPDWIYKPLRAKIDERNARPIREPLPPMEGDLELAKIALDHLSPDMPYDDWIDMGMALHNLNSAAGLSLWESWSSRGKKFRPGECERHWRTFHDGRISYTTLFWKADQDCPGWRPASNIIRVPKLVRRREPLVIKQAPTVELDYTPVKPTYVTRALAVLINRVMKGHAETVLNVLEAVYEFADSIDFSAKYLLSKATHLTLNQIHRGLAYGKDKLFAKQPQVIILESDDSMENKYSDQIAKKSTQSRGRPSDLWRLLPYETIIKILCREGLQPELERQQKLKLATPSRVRDLHGAPENVGQINKNLKAILSPDDYKAEIEKIRKIVQDVQETRTAALSNLVPAPTGDGGIRQAIAAEWHFAHNGNDDTWSAERQTGISQPTLKRMGRRAGFIWRPNRVTVEIAQSNDLPVPYQFDKAQRGFPRSVSLDGSRAFPYSDARYIRAKMEELHCKVAITFQKASTIIYDPERAALEAAKLKDSDVDMREKGKSSSRAMPVEKIKVGYCGFGNPPGWTRKNWATPFLRKLGIVGGIEAKTDFEILVLLIGQKELAYDKSA